MIRWLSIILIALSSIAWQVFPFKMNDGKRIGLGIGSGSTPSSYWSDTNQYLLLIRMQTNSSGNLIESSGNNIVVTNYGGLVSFSFTNTYGDINPVVSQDGSDDDITASSVVISNALSLSSQFTYTVWMNIDHYISQSEFFSLIAPGANKWSVFSDFESSVLYVGETMWLAYEGKSLVGLTNQWHHWAFVFDVTQVDNSDRFKLYFDGVLQAPAYESGTYAALGQCTGQFKINNRYHCVPMKVDYAGLSSYAWSSNAVYTLYVNTQPSNCVVAAGNGAAKGE